MSHIAEPGREQIELPHALLGVVGELADSLATVSAKLRQEVASRPRAEVELRRELESARSELGRLREAMDSRAVIEQAKGMLMLVARIDAEEAFALLAETSRRERRKVRDLASELVAAAEAGLAPVLDFVGRARPASTSAPSLRSVTREGRQRSTA
jgi:ANTAR domain